MQIRRATDADQPTIVHIIKSVYDEYGFSWDAEGYNADLYAIEENYGENFWIAEVDGSPIGCVGLDLFPTIPGTTGELTEFEGALRIAGSDCELCRLYVLPEGRGKKIGRSLYETTIETAKALGSSQMEIWSDKKLVEAHKLYQKTGARAVGDRICDDPDESPEWGFCLTLDR